MTVAIRRRLKLILKNAQRQADKLMGDKILGAVGGQNLRDQYVQDSLKEMGLTGDWDLLNYALKMKPQTPGRNFARLGKAAKKQGKLVPVFRVSMALQGGDLRVVQFV